MCERPEHSARVEREDHLAGAVHPDYAAIASELADFCHRCIRSIHKLIIRIHHASMDVMRNSTANEKLAPTRCRNGTRPIVRPRARPHHRTVSDAAPPLERHPARRSGSGHMAVAVQRHATYRAMLVVGPRLLIPLTRLFRVEVRVGDLRDALAAGKRRCPRTAEKHVFR